MIAEGTHNREVRDELLTRFWTMVQDVGPLFWGWDKIAKGKGAARFKKLCEKHVWRVVEKSHNELDEIWKLATETYQSFCGGAIYPYGSMASPQDRAEICERIHDALEQGKPLVRGFGREVKEDRAAAHKPGAGESALENLFLVCGMVRIYLELFYAGIDTAKPVHVPRDVSTGEARFEMLKDQQPMESMPNALLLDRPLGGWFSADPTTRGARLTRQIVVLKSLWDMSTHLRGRRLEELLLEMWPELSHVAPINKPIV
jgi:hypothetical protein